MPDAPTERRCSIAARADRFEIGIEDRIHDRRADARLRKLLELRPDGIGALRNRGDVHEAGLVAALPRQHADEVRVVHRIERMILQRALVQRHGADEEIALIDRAAGFGERRRHEHDGVA